MKSLTPVPFTHVTVDDAFWAPRIAANRQATLPAEYEQCLVTGRIDSLRLTWQKGDEPVPHVFWDSDVAKWLEAASYSLATHPDPALDALVDEVVALVVSAQQPDGYLNVHFTVVEPDQRWANLRDAHELYCAGHLIEAAVAHFHATGKRPLLDAVRRYADYIATVFGTGPDQRRGYCGHQEIELALVKLYHTTGERHYLDLASYFIDERGRAPHYFDLEAVARGDDPKKFWAKTYAYNQSHAPVREQAEVVGHSVRAMYMYCAMADLAGELGDETLLAACERLWLNVCGRRMYVTGGIGSLRSSEGFSVDYDLPNPTAYAETCAAIGLVLWNWRLLQLRCDGRYADVMERALYNGVLSGVSLDGTHFFYDNPLSSVGLHHRVEWFDCACCPPNLARLLASFGQLIYSQGEREAAVHLYVAGSGQLLIGDTPVTLRQQTRYPWDGAVAISVELVQPTRFALRLRVPGWCRGARITLNGEPVLDAPLEAGYVLLDREWRSGDTVELDLPMPVERVRANPNVGHDAGRAALQRGPLVYCLEAVDNDVPPQRIVLPKDTPLDARFAPELLGGVAVITGDALAADDTTWQGQLYGTHGETLVPATITAVPYYAWDNREPGAMEVWLREG
ncbi:MAG: glycoside hydrolase family 127 protein [Chloroflexales bacterium]|nr:glycoside hydrolase family 127 protein [Chloroflexales bacterium]